MKILAGLALASLAALTIVQPTVAGPATAEAAAPASTGAVPATRAVAAGRADAPAEGPGSVRLAQALFQEGVHYERLPTTQPTSSPAGTIEVTEFFMYSCPHCFNFEPHVSRWLESKPAHVSFVRIPASFNSLAQLHAKAFYAAESLGVLDELHEEFFREFHVKRNRLNSEAAVVKFFVDHGVDRETFVKTMNSFPVDARLKKANTLAQRYRLSSVPTVYVNGKYRTDATMAGNYPRLLEVIDYLVAMERATAKTESRGSTSSGQ